MVNQALGNEHQMRKFQEECCEASAAVNSFLNGRDDSYDALASEFADVLISSASMRFMLMRAKPGLVEKKLSEKFQRLRERINRYLMHGGLKP
jgi:NTP pyrophosphatase (non-canonical NTP hydrolase)